MASMTLASSRMVLGASLSRGTGIRHTVRNIRCQNVRSQIANSRSFESIRDPPAARPPFYSLPELSLTKKVFAVSGGARGLGLVQTEALLESGAATVFILDRLPEPDAKYFELLDKYVSDRHTRLEYRQVDVTDEVNLGKIFGEIVAKAGRIDGLIAAAGIQQETPAIDYSIADVRKMMDVNIVGTFATAQAAAKEMIKLGTPGTIVLIASMSGSVANRNLLCAPYNCSKAAVVQMARGLACEWGKYGIRVNSISPGYIKTEMTKALFETDPHREIEWASQNPLERVSNPVEFRGAAVFLSSDASSFMTGADLKIDGGHTAW